MTINVPSWVVEYAVLCGVVLVGCFVSAALREAGWPALANGALIAAGQWAQIAASAVRKREARR